MTKFTLLAALTGLAVPAIASGQAPATAVSLLEAVRVAETQTGAGAFEAELEREGGKAYYEINLARGKSLTEVRVDAATGKILSSNQPRLANLLPAWAGEDMPRTPRRIGSMLETIERQTEGSVQEVGFDIENGKEIYEIEVSTAKGVAELHIDAATGKRMPVRYDD